MSYPKQKKCETMKNRSIIKVFTSTLLLLMFLLLLACSEKSDTINGPSKDFDASGDYSVLEIEDAMNSIQDASLENDMGFGKDFGKGKFPSKGKSGDGKSGHHSGAKGKGLHLGRIFYKLDLNEDQIAALKTLMEGNRESLAEPFEQFREAAKEIMEGMKEQVRAIREEVKAGNLTRKEAHEQLKILNKATREEIKNCEACIEARVAICAYNTNLFESIGTDIGLTTEQLEVWNKWLSVHPLPCTDG